MKVRIEPNTVRVTTEDGQQHVHVGQVNEIEIKTPSGQEAKIDFFSDQSGGDYDLPFTD